MKYTEIKTNEDVATLFRVSNGMHDGHVVSVEYKNKAALGNIYDYSKISLRLRILVSSVKDMIVELLFDTVYDYRIVDSISGCDILGFSLSLDEYGNVTFTDDLFSPDFEDSPNVSYVKAKHLCWRVLEDAEIREIFG